MIKQIYKLCLLFLLLFPILCDGQNSNFFLEIQEKNYHAPNSYIYKIEDNLIEISEIVNKSKPKLVYKRKLNNEMVLEIKEVLKQIDILKLHTCYCDQRMDGFFWSINVEYDQGRKFIAIENTLQPEINTLFKVVNKYIKKRKFWITFTFSF